MIRLLASLFACACFATATLLSSAPTLRAGVAPNAEAVRRARDSAVELAMVLAADGTPRRVALSRASLEASAILVEHGIAGMRVRPSLIGSTLVIEANARLARSTWLDAAVVAGPRPGGFPHTALRIGAWHIPAPLVDHALALLDRWLARRDPELPPIAALIGDFAVARDSVSATVSVPRRFVRAVGALGGSEPRIDEALLRRVYGRLLEFDVHQPHASFAMTLRRAFADRPAGVDPVAYNRAAFVALAMHVVGPTARRLAGANAMTDAPMLVAPPELRVGGRPDLAKHFALSAALAVTLEPRFTRAMGEWKELDDSLPGGSGFSFVDLTADRAGMHLGRAAIDPATAARVADLLADTNDTALFPTGAHALAEGLPEAEFTRRYGGLAAASYAEAVKRVDRLLAGLDLYAPFVRPS